MARKALAPTDGLGSARARVERAAALSGGKILVGLSGGKDSLATLDLCCASNAFRRVEAFFMYLVPGLEVFEEPVDAAARRHGVLVHKIPHWDLPRLIKHAIFRPHVAGADKIRELRLRDIERALTAQLGIAWFAYGDRGSDGYARSLYTRKVDGVHPDWHRLWPVWDWKDPDVYGYLRMRGIPQPPRIGEGKTSGFSIEAESLIWLKAHSPSDYRKVLLQFPYAEADIERQRRKPKPVPKVRGRARASQRA